MRSGPIEHRFVTEVPLAIEPGVLYVSIPYATAVHICPGCTRKVATPFAPRSWNLVFDGETVSIYPSIRNRAHGCGSHYWIRNDQIVEAFDAWPDHDDHGEPERLTTGRSMDAVSWLRMLDRDRSAR